MLFLNLIWNKDWLDINMHILLWNRLLLSNQMIRDAESLIRNEELYQKDNVPSRTSSRVGNHSWRSRWLMVEFLL